ncbi:hypothetical protein DLAC_04539 [Tieghemostelium lacteum]|uniref:Transmembrane protein n=1 Tax=Tieghemostelium lacteum TaxID=361077 RepID=A0A151ZKA0_TIELA|nr:hypothetical protein DLAC_04539 [Tieghemostelium lacteum]|eukprot:KYQ94244.1 hypothetical protein DLAC_04539 [Tieghemostelium lacteum]
MAKENRDIVVEDDDEDDIESVKGPTRSSPFHLLGGFCFILAIIEAIVCGLVSTLIDVSSSTKGYIFFGTFVAFILLLFFCLCCTYYLGASREAWETPTYTDVRWNFTNLVAMAGLFVEFIQICSFSFNDNFAEYKGSHIFSVFRYVATPYPNGQYFEIAYWVMFVVAFSPYIFVIAIRILIYMYGMKKGPDSAASVVEKYQDNIYSILWFLVNTLYFPVITMMLSGTSCTFSGTYQLLSGGPPIPVTEPILDANPSIVCLQGKHIGFLVCTMVALVIYYPAASFAQSQTQNISDIKFKPKIVFVMLQGKFVLGAICASFGYRKGVIYLVCVVIINFFFLALNVFFKPCLLPWVNRLRTIFFSLSFWASLILVISYRLENSNHVLPLILLLVGWAAIITFLVIFYLGYAQFLVRYKDAFLVRFFNKHSGGDSSQNSKQDSVDLDEVSVHSNNPKPTNNNNNTPSQNPPPSNKPTINNNIEDESESDTETN